MKNYTVKAQDGVCLKLIIIKLTQQTIEFNVFSTCLLQNWVVCVHYRAGQ